MNGSFKILRKRKNGWRKEKEICCLLIIIIIGEKIVGIWDLDTSTFRYRGEKNERHIERSLWKVCDPKSRRSVRIPGEARKPLGQKWKKDPGPLTQHPGLHLLFCYWLLQRRQLFLCYQRRRSPLRLSCSVFWCCPPTKEWLLLNQREGNANSTAKKCDDILKILILHYLIGKRNAFLTELLWGLNRIRITSIYQIPWLMVNTQCMCFLPKSNLLGQRIRLISYNIF